MKVEIIKEYINQENCKNTVLAEYLKDNLEDTISFISTCSKEELMKVLYVLKSVALYFNDDYIVEIAEDRAQELSIARSKGFFNEIRCLFDNYYDEFRLIKPIVDAIDPLGLIEKNDKLYSYDNSIMELCDSSILFDLDNKLNKIFRGANKEKILKLSEQIKTSLKDGSIDNVIKYKQEYVTYYFGISDDTIGVILIYLDSKNCEYFECEDIYLGGLDDYGNECVEIDAGELYVKLLCNEFLKTNYDLDECREREYKNFDGTFQIFSTYKDKKRHRLIIDSCNKRYIYDVSAIDYYDSFYNRNEFIFDAIFNGIKKLGFKRLVLKEDDNE